MRKFLMPGLVLSALIAGCETKTPSGPTGLTPTTSTTTSITVTTTPTTSTSSTTSIVLASLARRYVAFQPPPNVPSEMTLFFELLAAGSTTPVLGGLPVFGSQTAQEAENRYRVTGVYVMLNGTTGTITGLLGGSSNPLETGGDFTGTLSAATPSGCAAERTFAGRLLAQTLQWTGGDPGTSTCSPSPLAMSSISMLRSDPSAPLPSPPPPTTTTVTTTTTSIPCTATLNPSSLTIDGRGGARPVAINIPPGCAWATHSFADWITIDPSSGGSGPSTVTLNVQPSSTARTGTLLIAGQQFIVTQTGALPDLVPPAMAAVECTYESSSDLYRGTIHITNQGTAEATLSLTRFVFTVAPGQNGQNQNGSPAPIPALDVPTSAIPPGGSVPVPFEVPDRCFDWREFPARCNFTITADHGLHVLESNEQNNGPVPASCSSDND